MTRGSVSCCHGRSPGFRIAASLRLPRPESSGSRGVCFPVTVASTASVLHRFPVHRGSKKLPGPRKWQNIRDPLALGADQRIARANKKNEPDNHPKAQWSRDGPMLRFGSRVDHGGGVRILGHNPGHRRRRNRFGSVDYVDRMADQSSLTRFAGMRRTACLLASHESGGQRPQIFAQARPLLPDPFLGRSVSRR